MTDATTDDPDETATEDRAVNIETARGPLCTALGCTDEANVEIELPDGRTRWVCDDHADDGTVVADV